MIPRRSVHKHQRFAFRARRGRVTGERPGMYREGPPFTQDFSNFIF